MNKKIQVLDNNDCFYDCVGPWISLLLLADTPRQEKCTNIKSFIWHSCVSYRPLKSVNYSFEFSIPCCNDSIEVFSDSSDVK